MTSILSAFPFLGEQSFATPGAWNSPLSIISANIAAVNAAGAAVSGVTISPPSGNTIQMPSDLSISGHLSVGKGVSIGTQAPSIAEPVALTIGVNSGISDYIYFNDSANLRSDYLLGSHAGGTADGLNIFDVSGNTMIVSFSKQSVRFYQNVVGPVFDIGGSLASTLNAATFGSGADSRESRIQAAINQAGADGTARVYVPANMLPYSAGSISFATAVQMVREGGDWSIHDVRAYGASGSGVSIDDLAIQSALTNAYNTGLDGGISAVYLPAGTYQINQMLTVPSRVRLYGTGRGSRIRANAIPSNSTMVSLGTGTVQAFNCRLENLMLECASTTGIVGVQSLTAQDQCGLRNVIINNFTKFGVYFSGAGGAGSVNAFEIADSEIYKAITGGSGGTGIHIDAMTFPGKIQRTSIVAGVANPMLTAMFFGSNIVASYAENITIEQSTNGVYAISGDASFQNITCNGVTNAVHLGNAANVVLVNVERSGGTNVLVDDGVGITPASTFTSVMLGLYVRLGRASPILSEYPTFDGLVIRGTAIYGRDGSGVIPLYSFASETSLGLLRSGVSTIQQSYGTFAASGLSTSYLAIDGSQIVLNANTNASNVILSNTTRGNIADDIQWQLKNNGTIFWRVGTSIWSSNGEFGIYDNGLGKYVLSFDTATGSAAFPSAATVNLLQSRFVSMRTLAASALTASAANTNVARDEAVFTIGGASGASLAIHSGGTVYIFNSILSAKAT